MSERDDDYSEAFILELKDYEFKIYRKEISERNKLPQPQL